MSEMVVRPRKKFDREYATEWRKERDWLAERGFEPTYVKRVGDGIERYKYKKTAALFEALELFYRMQENERQWINISTAIGTAGQPLDIVCGDIFNGTDISMCINAADEEDDTL